MSATIIAFPSSKADVTSQAVGASFDITAPDARGFVLVDACVSMTLAIEFMNLVTLYADTEGFVYPEVQDVGPPCISNYDRPEFDFDIMQPEHGGLVLIDACVPATLAYEFKNVVIGSSASVAAVG
jgi:hypothetical protein